MAASRPEVVIVAEDAKRSGGAERVALDSAVALAAAGHPVSLFTAGRELDPDLDPALFREVALLDLPPYWDRFFPAPRGEKIRTLLSEPGPYRAFSDFLARRKPGETIVHVHGFHSRLTTGVLAAALDGGFPTTATMHDFGLSCPIATLYDYPAEAICERTPLSLACWSANCIAADARPLKLLRAFRTLGQRTKLGVDRRLRSVVAVSEFCANVMRPILPGRPEIRVLPNPVGAAPGPPAAPETAHEILWAGRMTAEKDPLTAARAAARAGVPIAFAGDGPLRAETKAANPQAKMLGWLAPEENAEAMARSRAFLLTSRWYETASLVVLEAMARGIPPVVPSRCAATEWFEDGVEGLVFPIADEDGLVAALERLRDDELVARLGRAAHARYWSSPYTMERHLAGLEAYYAEMMR